MECGCGKGARPSWEKTDVPWELLGLGQCIRQHRRQMSGDMQAGWNTWGRGREEGVPKSEPEASPGHLQVPGAAKCPTLGDLPRRAPVSPQLSGLWSKGWHTCILKMVLGVRTVITTEPELIQPTCAEVQQGAVILPGGCQHGASWG